MLKNLMDGNIVEIRLPRSSSVDDATLRDFPSLFFTAGSPARVGRAARGVCRSLVSGRSQVAGPPLLCAVVRLRGRACAATRTAALRIRSALAPRSFLPSVPSSSDSLFFEPSPPLFPGRCAEQKPRDLDRADRALRTPCEIPTVLEAFPGARPSHPGLRSVLGGVVARCPPRSYWAERWASVRRGRDKRRVLFCVAGTDRALQFCDARPLFQQHGRSFVIVAARESQCLSALRSVLDRRCETQARSLALCALPRTILTSFRFASQYFAAAS